MTTAKVDDLLHPTVVLVATDLSSGSAEALRQGHRIAQRYCAKLVVVHVGHALVGVNPLFPELSTEELERQQAGAGDIYDALAREVALVTGREGEQQVALDVAYGDPAAEILAFAKRERADLIVLGDSGARGLGRIGRTSKKVLRGAAVPVLIARAHASTDVTLAATDFSDPAVPAVVAAAAYADGRLLLFHNVAPPVPTYAAAGLYASPPPAAADDARVFVARDRLRAEAARIGAPAAQTHVTYSNEPVAGILATAHAEAADLIVVGTHGRGALGRLLHGSVAERVAQDAACSVLVVRLAHANA